MHSFARAFISIYCLIFFFSPSVHAHLTPKTSLTVMTFNIENGGTQVDFNQVVKAIQQSHADVVGIQEAWGNTKRLAQALKWQYYDPGQHVISRYPLFKAKPQQKYVFVEINPNNTLR